MALRLNLQCQLHLRAETSLQFHHDRTAKGPARREQVRPDPGAVPSRDRTGRSGRRARHLLLRNVGVNKEPLRGGLTRRRSN